MKSNIDQFLLIAFMAIGSACYAQSKIDTVTIKTRITCDHCKTCETCGLKFEQDLYFEKGIKSSTFNPADTTITVIYKNTKTDPGLVRSEIARLGYDADDVPADPEAYQKLDTCCRRE